MKRSVVVCIVVSFIVGTANAATVSGEVSTLLASQPRGRQGDIVDNDPLYGFAQLRVDDIDLGGIASVLSPGRLYLQGWGRLQLGEDPFRDDEGDIGLAYFEFGISELKLRLGRQHIIEGIGRMTMLDGVSTRLALPWGMELQGSGGAIVHPRLRFQTGDWLVNGRLSKRFANIAELGIGYRHERRDRDLARHQVGADGWLNLGPTSWHGLVILTAGRGQLAEARLSGRWRVTDALTVSVDGNRLVPDRFLPATSIFTVFSNRAHERYGADVLWELSPYYDISARADWLRMGNAHLGYRLTAGVRTYREPSHLSMIGLEGQRLHEEDNGYWRGRALTALQLLDNFRISGDAFVFGFDHPVNGNNLSWLLQGSAVYDVLADVHVSATVSGGSTAFEKERVDLIFRLAYGYRVDLTSTAVAQ